jgi:hypothetical protein
MPGAVQTFIAAGSRVSPGEPDECLWLLSILPPIRRRWKAFRNYFERRTDREILTAKPSAETEVSQEEDNSSTS